MFNQKNQLRFSLLTASVNAVDGIKYPALSTSGACSCTIPDSSYNWLSVDLGTAFTIKFIQITVRMDSG